MERQRIDRKIGHLTILSGNAEIELVLIQKYEIAAPATLSDFTTVDLGDFEVSLNLQQIDPATNQIQNSTSETSQTEGHRG